MSEELPNVVDLLVKPAATRRRLAGHPERMVDLLRRGLPLWSLAHVADALQVSEGRLSSMIGLTERTLQRRRRGEHGLKPIESDRLYRVAQVFARAAETFGSTEKAQRWIHSPSRALGGEVPFELLDTEVGEEQVRVELERIDHGIFS